MIVRDQESLALCREKLLEDVQSGNDLVRVRPIDYYNYNNWLNIVNRDLLNWSSVLPPTAQIIFNRAWGPPLHDYITQTSNEQDKLHALTAQINALRKLVDMVQHMGGANGIFLFT